MDVILLINEYLTIKSRAALARTCRSLYEIMIPCLYRPEVRDYEVSGYDQNGDYTTEIVRNCAKLSLSAVELNNIPMLERLIQFGADLNVVWTDTDRWYESSAESERYCISHSSADTTNQITITVLHMAAMVGKDDIVTWLLRKGVSIDRPATGRCGCLQPSRAGTTSRIPHTAKFRSPLHLAICHGKLMSAFTLIAAGAPLSPSDTHFGSITPLQTAAVSGEPGLMQYMIIHGADINELDCNGYSAIHYAMRSWGIDTLRELIRLGADTRGTPGGPTPPLFEALQSCQYDAASVLLRA